MEATIAAAPTARHLHGTGIPAMREILGENFTPFSLVKAQEHFGVDLRGELPNFTRVPWGESTLRDCANNHVLVFIPGGVSLRELMATFPALFNSTELGKSLLDYAPRRSRYCLMSVWVRRHHTHQRDDESPADFHTVVYAMAMALLVKRKLFITDKRLFLHNHNAAIMATVSYEGDRIAISLPNERSLQTMMGLCERAPSLG